MRRVFCPECPGQKCFPNTPTWVCHHDLGLAVPSSCTLRQGNGHQAPALGLWGGEQQQLQKARAAQGPRVPGLGAGGLVNSVREQSWWDTLVPRLRLQENQQTYQDEKGAVTGRTRGCGRAAGWPQLAPACRRGLAPSCKGLGLPVRRGVSSAGGSWCGRPETMRRVPGGPRASIPILHLTRTWCSVDVVP